CRERYRSADRCFRLQVAPRFSLHLAPRSPTHRTEEPMNELAMAPPAQPDMCRDTDEDVMTRRQVAALFRVTSAAVATWARRGRLPEVYNGAGRPRYRRGDVEALIQSGFRPRTR